ncbi:MAG: transposase [Gammaproteobacteria bacterium]
MPRHPRIQLDGIPLHIVQRGHNREPCFFGEEDYFTYLHWLGGGFKETSCPLHAYALMSNHVHLLLTPKRAASVGRVSAPIHSPKSAPLSSSTLRPQFAGNHPCLTNRWKLEYGQWLTCATYPCFTGFQWM